VLNSKTIHAVVPLMVTCGMYNGAGKFVKDWGVPSKSGVSGALLTVIPNLGACVNYSPKLNSVGNTVKGIGMIGLLS
jgi:glutaminase